MKVANKALHTHGHSSRAHNSQDVATAQRPGNGYGSTRSGPALQRNTTQPERGRNADTCYSVDEPEHIMLSERSPNGN